MPLKCILGFHNMEKFLGPETMPNSKIMQRYKCMVCGKVKQKTS